MTYNEQHHQKKVQRVNTFYNELVTKALPQSTVPENTEESKGNYYRSIQNLYK